MGNCITPCENRQEEADYNENIDAIRQLVKGNFKDSLQRFRNQMKSYAKNLKFEDAQRLKEKIEILENYQSKSTVVNPKIGENSQFF